VPALARNRQHVATTQPRVTEALRPRATTRHAIDAGDAG